MTYEEFAESVASHEEPPADLASALQALWWAQKGDWDRAHRTAQDIPSADGSWVHAHLHREEGDEGNARYWYSRAGRPPASEGIGEEREAIIRALL